MPRRSDKCVAEGSKYAHWIGLFLSFHLNWAFGPFVHGRLQDLQTSEVTFVHVIAPLRQSRGELKSMKCSPTFNFDLSRGC